MKDYIQNNKAAWEEAFEIGKENYGHTNCERLKNEVFPFVYDDLVEQIKHYHLKGKRIGQICCNNGRELMSIVKGTNAESGVGFDIAENIIEQAKEHASISQIPCEFVACNALDINEKYHKQFDAIFILVGAICWFEDLEAFYR